MVVGTVLPGPTVGTKCSRRLKVGRNPDELLMVSLQALVVQLLENKWGLLLRLHSDAQVSKSIKLCISSEYNVKKQVEILPEGGCLFIRPYGLFLSDSRFFGY